MSNAPPLVERSVWDGHIRHLRRGKPSAQDIGEIFKLIGGYRISQAIYVVVEIGIPDLLAAGPKNSDEEVDVDATTGEVLNVDR